ncbi:MAG: glycine--tRNA ligase subunit beta [Candidatus Eisenbacteria bacterium]|nr:glycine--tRNA ligase subunit beta [Candidatus Eisenbacteria bacterium]
MRKTLLIEIGTEEIPAGYLSPALDAFAEKLASRLTGERILFERMERFATPRRLALRALAVEEMQPDREREVTGPPARIAFDADGNPTKAAIGFAKTQGIALTDLRKVTTDKGEYLAATVTDHGRATAEILADLVPEILASLPFPRTMRWESGGFVFARPIRWIVALLGGDVIDIAVAGVRSGRTSRGHRQLHPDPVRIDVPESYEEALRAAFVIVSPEERRSRIAESIAEAAAAEGGRVIDDPGLLDTVGYLVEHPHAVVGRFEERFLALPARVVITAMRSHQKYFSVADESGRLLPRFVAVANGTAGNEAEVRAGNERVLAARLADAEFYWNEDRSVPLAERVERLDRILWQEGMGSLLEKTERIEAIAGRLAAEAAPEAKGAATRAARLAKADLTTEMIRDGKEFTALQGYMGMEYARASGEEEDVARAIFEQYLPRFSGDALPETVPGVILSLADRIDTLIGCFAAGLVPSGSQDPYALRRSALGVVRMLAEERVRLDLGRLLAAGVEVYGGRLDDPEKILGDLRGFFRRRIRNLLVDEKGLPYDVTDAVLEIGIDRPADLEPRIRAIDAARADASFERLVFGCKRVMNILKGQEPAGDPDPALFRQEEEKGLAAAAEAIREGYVVSLEAGEYGRAMEMLLTLRDPIDRFFDAVLVMDKDDLVRRNRIALLQGTAQLFRGLADLSKVVLEGERDSSA